MEQPRAQDTVLVLDAATLGRGDDDLGSILMVSFLRTIAFRDEAPGTIVCYNAGVKLAEKGSAAVPMLETLAQKGADIVLCGTCVNYFNLSDRLAIRPDRRHAGHRGCSHQVRKGHLHMSDPYVRLAAALDALPNGFPRTESGKEIQILHKIFSPEEAEIASHLTGEMELPARIAARAGIPAGEATGRLKAMAKRGMVWLDMDRQARSWRFRLAPFIVGMYEASLELMDHELAHLVEDYMAEGGAEGIMRPEPALHRVVPARQALQTEWVLPYEDVVKILEQARGFSVRECICRTQQDHLGRKCDFPTHNCLTFSGFGRPPGPDSISREEALALLDESERLGLVHTVSNVVRDVYYVCNCCGCCCGILRGVNERGIENSVAKAGYLAEIDPEICSGCGICLDRCQVHAIEDAGGVPAVNADRCIGCGLCVTGCSTGAALCRGDLTGKPSGRRRPSLNGNGDGWKSGKCCTTDTEVRPGRRGEPAVPVLLVAIHDPAPVQVVGRQLHLDPVTGEDANEELSHLA